MLYYQTITLKAFQEQLKEFFFPRSHPTPKQGRTVKIAPVHSALYSFIPPGDTFTNWSLERVLNRFKVGQLIAGMRQGD